MRYSPFFYDQLEKTWWTLRYHLGPIVAGMAVGVGMAVYLWR